MAICSFCGEKIGLFKGVSKQPVYGRYSPNELSLCENCNAIFNRLDAWDVSAYETIESKANSTEDNPVQRYMREWKAANPGFIELYEEYRKGNLKKSEVRRSNSRLIQKQENNTLSQRADTPDHTKCRKCGRTVMALTTGKVVLSGGLLCTSCYQSLGFSALDTDALMKFRTKTYDQVLAYSRRRMKDHTVAQFFTPTYAPAPYCKFNDHNQKMLVSDRVHLSYKPEHYTVFNYDQIISYELLEDGTSIASGGLGRAAVGGFLFGGVGAVVGGLTRSYKGACTRLQIKLTVKDYDDPAFFITLINSPTKKDSIAYKTYIKEAESIISKLQLIVGNREEAKADMLPSANTESVADQIRSFKALLDDGIITQEEFDAKKKQLLGI